jgi:holo-[acyl-carrier protein] synthase
MRYYLQMMQSCIGVDIIEIDRIRQVINRWGDRFLKRIYTEAELTLCRGRVESLAARFSGKEAVIKALNPPQYTVNWKDIEILSGPNGEPLVNLGRELRKQAEKLGLSGVSISLSHSRENAVAMAIGIGDRNF